MSITLNAAEQQVAPELLEGSLVSCQLVVPRLVMAAHGMAANGSQHQLAVNGSVSQLGLWAPDQAVRLMPSTSDESILTANVMLPVGELIEAKVQLHIFLWCTLIVLVS